MVIPVSMVIVSGVVVLPFNCCHWWRGRGRGVRGAQKIYQYQITKLRHLLKEL